MSKVKNIYSTIAYLIITIVIVFTTFKNKRWEITNVIFWDVTSYYAYLPATFIHKDITLKFTETDGVDYWGDGRFWPKKAENGGLVIKSTMGLSILYAPFFGMAHLYTKFSDYPSDGFSEPYEMFLCFSSVFYMLLGLFILSKILLKYFSDRVTATTILSVVLGTNLFHYTTVEAPMSHSYNFALLSFFVYLLMKWYSNKTVLTSISIGLLAGLITLIRPVNVLIVVIPFLLFNVKNIGEVKNRVLELFNYWKQLLFIIICAFLVVLPQLLYWKFITGDWLYNSYQEEWFYFSNPHILEGLFSFRKGWLLYTPIMFFSLFGMFFLHKKLPQMKLFIPLLFIAFIYVIFSWWTWWYGGSYSCRPMIDIYPILAIPMAVFYSWVSNQKVVLKSSIFVICYVLIAHSIFQTKQYWSGSIHHDSMTKAAYFNSFGTLKPKPEFWSLIKTPDYSKALKGEE